jgi:hypothetical protein
MDQVEAAARRLEAARAVADTAYQTGGLAALRTAHEEQLAAERELARVRDEQYAEPLDLGLRWDPGAPLPHVISDSWRTFVFFLLAEPDPDWDGTYVRVVSAGDTAPAALGLVEFTGAYLTSFGGLNDEALSGHPLSGRGLAAYRAFTVRNSTWIAQAEQHNAVHPRHRGGWHERYHHYVLTFHDETFECIAENWRAERLRCSLAEAIAIVAARITNR